MGFVEGEGERRGCSWSGISSNVKTREVEADVEGVVDKGKFE